MVVPVGPLVWDASPNSQRTLGQNIAQLFEYKRTYAGGPLQLLVTAKVREIKCEGLNV